MNKMYPMNKAFLASAVVMLSNNVFGTIIIQNNFDGVADDIGPAFQLLSNGAGGATGTFDPSTGVISTGTGTSGNNTGASGINNTSLATIPVGTTSFTVEYVIDSFANAATIRSNGFFLGVATDAGATVTTGDGLFNNTAASIGLNLLDPPGGSPGVNEGRIAGDGASGGTTNLESITSPTFASVEDGFTFTLTVRDDNTYDAFTTGLSTDVSIINDNLTGGSPLFADFVSGGIGINSTTQGNGIDGGVGPSGFTVGSVTLSAVPEPSTSILVGLVSGLALFGRRRRSF